MEFGRISSKRVQSNGRSFNLNRYMAAHKKLTPKTVEKIYNDYGKIIQKIDIGGITVNFSRRYV